MATLTDLKAVEITHRNRMAQETISEFKDDIEWAYRFTRARRRLAERRAGIRGIALWTEK